MAETIASFAQLADLYKSCARVLVLFSGGVDGSYALSKLDSMARSKTLALTVDIGGGVDADRIQSLCNRFDIPSKVVSGKASFCSDFILPSIWSCARYLNHYPISASLSRPHMASIAARYAAQHGFDVIIHTATPSQNSLRRFNNSFKYLSGTEFRSIRAYGSPFVSPDIPRREKIAHLGKIGLSQHLDSESSHDINLWAWEIEAGALDDPERFDFDAIDFPSNRQETAPGPSALTIHFHEGMPTQIDGKSLDLVGIVEHLTAIGQAYRIGRFVGLEEIDTGRKVQEIREMPAAEILYTAYRYLENACVDAETIRVKQYLEQLWVREAVEGRWFGVLRSALELFIARVAKHASGTVTLAMDQNACRPMAVSAGGGLYVKSRLDLDLGALPPSGEG